MTANAVNDGAAGTRQIDRLFRICLALLPLLTLACLPWGWEAAVSCLTGGTALLAAFSATRAAVTGVAVDDVKIRGRLRLRLAWRLLLLALCLYAMLQAPWTRLVPLTVGLSLFFPALVVELVIQVRENRSAEATPQKNTDCE